MQIRSAAPAVRPVAARPLTAPAPQAPAGQAPAPKLPVKARNADSGFGSEIFQSLLYSLTNLGQIVTLPGGISGLIQALGGATLGVFNIVMGGMNLFKDWRAIKKPNNTRMSDDYTRLA